MKSRASSLSDDIKLIRLLLLTTALPGNIIDSSNVVIGNKKLPVLQRVPATERENVARALELLYEALQSESSGEPILIKLEDDL